MQRRALLIGLNYNGVKDESELTGCINDVINVRKFLIDENLFKSKEIDIYKDHTSLTKVGIMMHLNDLCVSTWRDNLELVFFHYSGHGRQIKDTNGDEEDSLDEGIVPLDWNEHGTITDDVLSQFFMNCNPKTKIVCVFDCCHSSTILDLKYNWSNKKTTSTKKDMKRVQFEFEFKNDVPQIICLSACKDKQIASELHEPVPYRDEIKTDSGIFTSSLLLELSDNPFIPLLDLQVKINQRLKQLGYSQISGFSSSFPISSELNLHTFTSNKKTSFLKCL